MNDEVKKIIGNSNYVILENGGELVVDSDSSLKIIHFINKDSNIKITIEKNVSLHLEEIFYDVKNDINIFTEIECKEGSKLEYLSFKKCQESENIVINTKANLYQGAYIDSKNITALLTNCKYKQEFNLLETKSEINSLDIIINASEKEQKFDLDTIHHVNNTSSKMHNYCISKNNSIIHMNTNGNIKKDAVGAVLSQKTKGLLLDEFSQISANPLLVIDEFDCIASHGAGVGAIDEEELYYLMSRGLTKEASERLIVEGFIHPFIFALKDEQMKNYCLEWITKIL